MNLFSSRGAFKVIGCSAIVAFSVALASEVHAQNSYYQTTFDNDAPNNTLSGQDGWTDNDPNQPDGVGVVGTYSSTTSDNIASVGGDFLSVAAPSTSPVYLSHPFTSPTASYRFDVDYFVTSSVSPYPADTNAFAFTFRGTNVLGGTINLFSIDLVPNGTGTNGAGTTADAIRYTVYNPLTGVGTQTSTGLGSVLNSRYHLDLSVNEATNSFTFSISEESQTGTLGTVDYTSPAIALTLGEGSLISSIAATYLLGPGNATGSNALFFDNFSAVPEPSTWAMMGLGTLGLVVSFRRKARA